jgi:hypothetical protein
MEKELWHGMPQPAGALLGHRSNPGTLAVKINSLYFARFAAKNFPQESGGSG